MGPIGSQAGSQQTPKKHGQLSSSALSNLIPTMISQTSPYLLLTLNNIERQVFDKSERKNARKQHTLDTELCNRVTFDVTQPTNPQAHVIGLDAVNSGLQVFSLLNQSPTRQRTPTPEQRLLIPLPPSIPALVLAVMCSSQTARIYITDGKCQGMLTPERIDILNNVFDRAKHSGMHDAIQPPPKSFASGLMGLFSRSTVNSSKQQSKKSKTPSCASYLILPTQPSRSGQ
eukprot:1160524-Pelagomonas_calceolata.AAC.1